MGKGAAWHPRANLVVVTSMKTAQMGPPGDATMGAGIGGAATVLVVGFVGGMCVGCAAG